MTKQSQNYPLGYTNNQGWLRFHIASSGTLIAL
jgi:hypothetical protein